MRAVAAVATNVTLTRLIAATTSVLLSGSFSGAQIPQVSISSLFPCHFLMTRKGWDISLLCCRG